MDDPEPVKSDSLDAIERVIESVTAKLRTSVSIDEFVDDVHALVSLGTRASGSILPTGIVLYRVTGHHKAQPESWKDVFHPPPERTPMGRANRAESPLLYLASDPGAAILEYRPEPGKMLCLTTWHTVKPAFVQNLGYLNNVFADLGAKRAVPDQYLSDHMALEPASRRVREFISNAFTQTDSSMYPFTAAIAEVHLRGEQINGLRYPSIAKKANTDNVALTRDFVSTGIKLARAKWLVMDDLDGGYSLAEAEVLADGRLLWTPTSAVESPVTQSRTYVAMPEGVGEVDTNSDGVLRGKPEQVVSRSVVPPGGAGFVDFGTTEFESAGEFIVEGKRYRVEKGYKLIVRRHEVGVRDTMGRIVAPEADEV